MLFNKNDERANERVLYKTKPNMILGCKKAILGVVLLAIVFVVSPMVIQFVGEMQVYLISQIKLPLTRYAAIAFFVVLLVIILYIIWQLLKWYSVEYTLTDTRIIVKSGVLSTKKNYMPYSTIQDINSSQSIIARLFNVGTVSVFSAYDNNLMSIKDVSNPSKIEEIIFSNMMGIRNFQDSQRNFQDSQRNFQDSQRNFQDSRTNFIDRNEDRFYSESVADDDYYDEFEPITPIGHEKKTSTRRDYEYYPEEFSFQEERTGNKYEYEPYQDELDYNVDRVMNSSNQNIRYEAAPNTFSNDVSYNEREQDYSYDNDDYYQYDESENPYDEGSEKVHQKVEEQVDETGESSETVIRRHFDKFKK
jgi:membrane protein YdbS with pleckstrin-like domain